MSANAPKLSVIIPVYNIAEYLPACLDSVLSQSYSDFELIAVNDGSPDNSLEILHDYAARDNRVKVVSKNNEGVNKARLSGFEASRGAYIWYIDGDDTIVPGAIEQLMAQVLAEDTDMLYFNYRRVDNDGNVLGNLPLPKFDNIESIDCISQVVLSYSWAVWMHIHKRELYDRMGHEILYLYKDVALGEDLLMTFKLIHVARKISKINSVFYIYLSRQNSATTQKVMPEKLYLNMRDMDSMLRDICSRFGTEEKLERELACTEMRMTVTMWGARRQDYIVEKCRHVTGKLNPYPELYDLIGPKDRKRIKFNTHRYWSDRIWAFYKVRWFFYKILPY